ncbi:MAG: sigma-70 family RNA polymerase sigma factor [Opitutae bacterium]|jgi:RNA polymerase sigma-70 factor (ECF subfamily)|nr:sigma-70 family RNA polymerase sigma factor [Opitutae bacterium]
MANNPRKNPRMTQEFVSLLTDHQEVIRAYIITQVPGCSEVRDIQQEVNILLWEKMNQFKLGSNFGAWACTVAYYKVLDYRKKQKKNGFLVFNDELASLLSLETETRKPEALEAKRSALHYCLQKLTDKERALLDARYDSATRDMEQVSRETGRSRASLRVSLSRLRSGLKDCINKRLAVEGGAA